MALTKKKMEHLLHRIWFHHAMLAKALHAAHRCDLIKYLNYKNESPCAPLWQVGERVEATTKDQVADIVQSDIRRKIK